MADLAPSRWYLRLVRWVEGLPRARYALVSAAGWLLVWTAVQAALGRSLPWAAVTGGLTGLFFGVLQYYLWEYRRGRGR